MNPSILIFILPFIIAVVLVILAFIFIVPEKRRSRLGKFGKFLHDTANFKYLIIEKIFQALYMFSTIFTFFFGFCLLFNVQSDDSLMVLQRISGITGLIIMIVGPIVIRLAYEAIMMVILLVRNVIQINNKLRDFNDCEWMNRLNVQQPVQPQAAVQEPVAKAAPTPVQKPVVQEAPIPVQEPIAQEVIPPTQASVEPEVIPATQAPMEAQETSKVRVCPACGATSETGNFCVKCGTKYE